MTMATATQRNNRAAQAADSEPAKNAPVHELRLGRIKGTVWLNETEMGVRYNTTFARLYRVDEQWRETQSFGCDDLPLLSKVADLIHTWIFANAQSAQQAESGPQAESAPQADIPFY
jgi:hypothetical protein